MQEPLLKIQTFASIILETEYANLSDQGKDYIYRTYNAANRMQILIKDLLNYSHIDIEDRKFEIASIDDIFKDVYEEFIEEIEEKQAVIIADNLGKAYINKFQFRQVITNLFSNALKFSKPGVPAEITLKYKTGFGLTLEKENPGLLPGKLSPTKNYSHLRFTDNGIGYNSLFKEQIFEPFQRLHTKE